MNIRNTALAAMLLSATAVGTTAQAQVAGMATTSKLDVVTGSKAFSAGYEAIRVQSQPKFTRAQQLETESEALIKPLDTNGDRQLTEADTAYVTALNQNDAVIKSLDANKDGTLTGTELEQYRARNLPVAQLITKRRELASIQREIRVSQLYVINAIDQKYDAALQSVVTARKISVVLAPAAFEWAPPAINITPAVIAELDRALPAVALPPPANFNASQDAIALHQQIEQIFAEQAAAAARAQQAQQAQGGQQPAGQPARPATGTQPPANPTPQPDSR